MVYLRHLNDLIIVEVLIDMHNLHISTDAAFNLDCVDIFSPTGLPPNCSFP